MSARSEKRWTALQEAVREHLKPNLTRRTDPGGDALCALAQRDERNATDALLEAAYEADAAGNSARGRYLMHMAGMRR